MQKMVQILLYFTALLSYISINPNKAHTWPIHLL